MATNLAKASVELKVIRKLLQVEFKLPKKEWAAFDDYLMEYVPEATAFLSGNEFCVVGDLDVAEKVQKAHLKWKN